MCLSLWVDPGSVGVATEGLRRNYDSSSRPRRDECSVRCVQCRHSGATCPRCEWSIGAVRVSIVRTRSRRQGRIGGLQARCSDPRRVELRDRPLPGQVRSGHGASRGEPGAGRRQPTPGSDTSAARSGARRATRAETRECGGSGGRVNRESPCATLDCARRADRPAAAARTHVRCRADDFRSQRIRVDRAPPSLAPAPGSPRRQLIPLPRIHGIDRSLKTCTPEGILSRARPP